MRLGILLLCLGHVDVLGRLLGLSPQSLGYGGHADGCLPCADGGLYTATRYEFRSLPDIRRNLHQRPLKTEESPLHWLNGKDVSVPWDWCLRLSRVLYCRGKLRQGGTGDLVSSQLLRLAPFPPDAEFVASMLVQESKDSPVGDDDKIYYFFMERAGEETTSFFDKSQVARVARVARVCKVRLSLRSRGSRHAPGGRLSCVL